MSPPYIFDSGSRDDEMIDYELDEVLSDTKECQRLAIEHSDDDYGAEPCILHGGDGDWCWAAALQVNEDGSYCKAGAGLGDCDCVSCEEMKRFEERRRDSQHGSGLADLFGGLGDKETRKSMAYMDKGKKRGLWDNVHAKRKRGEKAAKPGDKDYPDKKNWNKLTNKSYECGCNVCTTVHGILEKKDDKPFHGYNPNKHSKEGGLNAKGRAKAKKEEGANLKPPVTEKPSTLDPDSKKAKRRKSFCARMGGVKGPTSKEGKKTPKGAALDRWNC